MITTEPGSEAKAKSQLTQRSFLNALSAFLDYAARIGVSFVITPILVTGLGSTLYGVWQILIRLVSYMSATDGRPTHALKWVIANSQSSDDNAVKRRAISSALGVWLMMLPVLVLLGLLLAWFTPKIADANADLVESVRLTTAILVINFILTGVVMVPAAVLRGMNLGYKRMGVVAGLNVLGGALMVGAVYMNWGLVGLAAAYLVQTVLTGLLFWYLVKIYLPWFGVDRISLSEIREFFGLSKWYASWNFVDKLLFMSDVVLLGILLSASAVTSYVLTGYAVQVLVAVVTMMVGAAAPGLGGLVGNRQFDRVIILRKEMIWMSALVAGVSGFMILLWNRSFIVLWVGPEEYAGPWVNLLLVVIGIQLLFIRNETFLIDLSLDLKAKVLLGLVAALLSITLAILLTSFLGMLGLTLGILGGRLILSIGYPAITGRFLGVPLTEQFWPVLRPIVVMFGLFALSTYLGQIVVVESWLQLIVWSSVSFMLIVIFFSWTGFSNSQRSLLKNRVKKLKSLKELVRVA